jgi:hypothetical protein
MQGDNSVVDHSKSSVAEPRAEIKFSPGAGAKITNCGSGSGSCLFIEDLKKIYRKNYPH